VLRPADRAGGDHASRFALEAFNDSPRREVSGHGVRVIGREARIQAVAARLLPDRVMDRLILKALT
jgi:hypothetical protein